MTSSAKRLSVVLISTLLIIGSAVVLFTLILPEVKNVQQLRGKRASLASVVSEEKSTVENVSRLLNEYKSISDIQKSLSSTLPPSESISSLMNQLNGIAETSGVFIDSLDLQFVPIRTTTKKDSIIVQPGTIRVTMSLTAPYESIKTYIESLETNIRIIDMYSIKVSEGGKTDILKYRLVVDTYYQR